MTTRRACRSALGITPLLIPLLANAGGAAWTHEVQWLITDRVGSGVARIDAEGELLGHTRFRPFGGIDAEVSTDPGRHIFAGHPHQAETGLVQMQARWLNPDTGAFLSVDPRLLPNGPDFEISAHTRLAAQNRVESATTRVETEVVPWPNADPFANPPPDATQRLTPADLNAYAYAYQNPLSVVDPDGREGRYIAITVRFGAGLGLSKTFGIGFDHRGSISSFRSHGIGGHGGANLSATLSYGDLSPTATLSDLGGSSLEAGGSVGEGLTAGADAIVGGGRIVAGEVSVGVGGGTPLEAHGTVTHTEVNELVNLSEIVGEGLSAVADWISGAQ